VGWKYPLLLWLTALPLLLAAAFLALHLPYLPASLDDLDSINFALGLRHFDVARHQPHPPGYPLFILAGKAVHHFVPAEASALSLLSIVAGALGVLTLFAPTMPAVFLGSFALTIVWALWAGSELMRGKASK